MAQVVKNPPAMQETQEMGFDPRVGKIPLEKEMATQYFCLGNLMGRGAWQTAVHGVGRIRHNVATNPPQAPPAG